MTRTSDRINWNTIQFILENAVFLLVGLQIRSLIEAVNSHPELSLGATVGLGLLATALLIALRFLWVGPLILLLRRAADLTLKVRTAESQTALPDRQAR